MNRTSPLTISAYTATSCLGRGLVATRASLASRRSLLRPCRFLGREMPTWIGEVDGLEDDALPAQFASYECRNNRLALAGLRQDGFIDAVNAARQRHGATRIGVFLGSSTSGLLNSELAYQHRDAGSGGLPDDLHYAHTHNMYSLAAFVGDFLELQGPRSVGSIACASSAKVFATGARAIAAGLVDAVIVGGVDTLCLTTLYGFGSLELLAPNECRPFDLHRNGVSIGEAAAFFLLERDAGGAPGRPRLVGYGESSDAHHISSPHPQGLGAQMAMQAALQRAGIGPSQVDYVNLHGTATPSNDAAEDLAVVSVFGRDVPVSSTKGAHGHCLGAAGGLEAAVALLSLEAQRLPGGLNVEQIDPSLQSNYLLQDKPMPVRTVMSNSFGFGGANASLVFSGGGP
ncbi:MAG: beta-ketoacyl-[acyl-carrier-protein] synthase family protein [Burkholderiaceae bacterium]